MRRNTLLWWSGLMMLAGCGKDAAPRAADAADATGATAVTPACPPLPAAAAGATTAELDLDGTGALDRRVPTACDGDGTCTWALFVVGGGCPAARGSIEEVDRIDALPITVNGTAVVRTLSVSEYYRKEATLAWSGTAWVSLFTATCAPGADGWWCEATHSAQLSSGEPAPELPCVSATAAPAPTLDLDRDGTPDTLIALDCGADLQSMCGTLVLRNHAGCTRPLGFLPAGNVWLPDDLKAGEPARILVSRPDEAGTEERIELGLRSVDDGFEVLRTRTCDRDSCYGWMPPDRGAHE